MMNKSLLTGLGLGTIFTFILSCFTDALRQKLTTLFSNSIEWFLDKFNFKRSLYKKRVRDIQILLEKEVSDTVSPKEDPKIIFEEWSEHEKIPFNWRIIKIDKTLDRERIDKSIILQLPASSKYGIERNLMSNLYKKAFFLALSRRLAIAMNKYDVIDFIDQKVERLGVLVEFQTISEIVNSKDKFNAMIFEARRKWKYVQGNVGSSAKREFIRFIEDLSRGNVGIITVYSEPADVYLTEVKSSLSKYNIVHIYARGYHSKSPTLNRLQELFKLVKEKINNIKIQDLGLYDWENSDGQVIGQGRAIVLRRIKS